MRKLFTLLLVAAFLLSGSVVYAASNYASPNAEIMGPQGGALGISPMTQIIKVRYGRGNSGDQDVYPSLASGDVVIWDTNSADGVTISGCIVDFDAPYAGVLVTTIATQDSASNVRGSDKNWGYIAVKGYCLAKVDTSAPTVTGGSIVTNGATLIMSFATTAAATGREAISKDIGVLLTDTGADGLMPVWLR